MIKEFRNFINRGNVVELGVAFVMGASFKSLVDVFTKKLIEPLIGLIINLPNLDNLGLFGDIDPNSGLLVSINIFEPPRPFLDSVAVLWLEKKKKS